MNPNEKREFTYLKKGRNLFVSGIVTVVWMIILFAMFLFLPDLGLSSAAQDAAVFMGTLVTIAAAVATIYFLPVNLINGTGFAIFNENEVEITMQNRRHIAYYGDIASIREIHHGKGIEWLIATSTDKIRINVPHDSFGSTENTDNLKAVMAEIEKRVNEYQSANPQNIPKEETPPAPSKWLVAVLVVLMAALSLFFVVQTGRILHTRFTGVPVTGRVVNISSGRGPVITVRYEVHGQGFTERLRNEATFGLRAGDSIQLFHSRRDPTIVTTGRPDMVNVIMISFMFIVGGIVIFKKVRA
ncbi:MAG: hypothetical protein FWB96_04225 [Defluviitaleaceae bacterium]|nr:hypothetical protein [Defluviitaleaceae bacterium]